MPNNSIQYHILYFWSTPMFQIYELHWLYIEHVRGLSVAYGYMVIEQVSCARGTVTAYALISLEPRGTLFVSPGAEVITNPSHIPYKICV